jgi:hypothetical protein
MLENMRRKLEKLDVGKTEVAVAVVAIGDKPVADGEGTPAYTSQEISRSTSPTLDKPPVIAKVVESAC